MILEALLLSPPSSVCWLVSHLCICCRSDCFPVSLADYSASLHPKTWVMLRESLQTDMAALHTSSSTPASHFPSHFCRSSSSSSETHSFCSQALRYLFWWWSLSMCTQKNAATDVWMLWGAAMSPTAISWCLGSCILKPSASPQPTSTLSNAHSMFILIFCLFLSTVLLFSSHLILSDPTSDCSSLVPEYRV